MCHPTIVSYDVSLTITGRGFGGLPAGRRRRLARRWLRSIWLLSRSSPSWLLHSDSTASLVSFWSSGMPWTRRQLRRLYCSWASLSSRNAVLAVSSSHTRPSGRLNNHVMFLGIRHITSMPYLDVIQWPGVRA